MTKEEEIKKKILEDRDFINIKRFDYSLNKLLDRYEDGVPGRVIAQALLISEEEVESLYEQVLVKLRKRLNTE